MQKLIMMVGLSGSGKTTIAKQIAENINAEVLSSDEFRKTLLGNVNNQAQNKFIFNTLYQKAKELLSLGKNVIIDATNLESDNRVKALKKFKDIKCEKIAYIIATPFEKCLEQNSTREKKVSNYVIYKQLNKFEIPFYEEGFDAIYVDREPLEFKSEDEIFATIQDNSLAEHCKNSAQYFEGDRSKYDAMLFHDYGRIFINDHLKNYPSIGTYHIMTDLDYGNFRMGELLQMLFIINYHHFPSFNSLTYLNKKFGEKNTQLLMMIQDFIYQEFC